MYVFEQTTTDTTPTMITLPCSLIMIYDIMYMNIIKVYKLQQVPLLKCLPSDIAPWHSDGHLLPISHLPHTMVRCQHHMNAIMYCKCLAITWGVTYPSLYKTKLRWTVIPCLGWREGRSEKRVSVEYVSAQCLVISVSFPTITCLTGTSCQYCSCNILKWNRRVAWCVAQ